MSPSFSFACTPKELGEIATMARYVRENHPSRTLINPTQVRLQALVDRFCAEVANSGVSDIENAPKLLTESISFLHYTERRALRHPTYTDEKQLTFTEDGDVRFNWTFVCDIDGFGTFSLNDEETVEGVTGISRKSPL